MGLDFLSALENRIQLVDTVPSWQEAVKMGGQMLVDHGIANPDYVDKMIAVCQELGPYTAIAPGIAIPHARPEDGAKRFGFSLLVVKQGVEFGSHNDPVHLVLSFATPDKESHLEFLRQLATLLQNAEDIARVIVAKKTPEQVRSYLQQVISSQNSERR
ncbi:MAG: PTS sugar transporter subunit IIA [Anaerolineae bacterium]